MLHIFRLFIFATLLLWLTGCSNTPSKNTEQTINTINDVTSKPNNSDLLNIVEKNRYQLAIEQLKNNNVNKAESILLELEKTHKHVPGISANLALVYFKQNKLNKAKKTAEQAIINIPTQPQLHNLLGLIANQQHQFQAAEKHYQNAIKYNKNYSNAHYNLALLYDTYYQNIEKAIIHYKRYLEIIDFQDKNTLDWLTQLTYSLSQ